MSIWSPTGRKTGRASAERRRLIGWRVRPNGLDAITPEDHDVSTVKYPDGQVAVLGDQTYANEAEWLAAMEDGDFGR